MWAGEGRHALEALNDFRIGLADRRASQGA
jgi:hypothetical protein